MTGIIVDKWANAAKRGCTEWQHLMAMSHSTIILCLFSRVCMSSVGLRLVYAYTYTLLCCHHSITHALGSDPSTTAGRNHLVALGGPAVVPL